MTPLQWLFHYIEVNKLRNSELENTKYMFEILVDRLETILLAVNPSLSGELLKTKNQSNIKESPEDFTSAWENIMSKMPKEIHIKQKSPVPQMSRDQFLKRTVGISVQE